jgi:preprotein translocase subunit YajC|tara:strand:+ start:2555 stop:2932 length:378 start_codon:yes stop_codon:yes gene_type:complete
MEMNMNLKSLMAAAALLAPVSAFAEAPAAAPMGVTGQLVFLGGFLLIFYFLLWRPQSKRQKEHKALLTDLSKGDEVATAGGLVGKVIKVNDDFLMIEVADNVQLPVQKSAITAALPKGTIKGIKA